MSYLMRNLVFVMCVLRIACGQQQQQPSEPITISPIENTGILFEDMGTLLAFHSTWTILTELDLTELANQTMLAEKAEHLVHQLCKNRTQSTDWCTVQQVHVHSLLENIKRRTETIREGVPKSRRTRSIFDGIGNALHYLFGTMDSTNEKEIYSRLSELESDTQALAKLEKQQISVVKTTLQQIQKPLTSLLERQRQVNLQINNLLNTTDELKQGQLRQELITSLLLQIVEIEFRQQALLDIIESSKTNHIHPLLISPNKLLEVYHKSHSTCPEPQDCLSLLYQTAQTQAFLMREKLIIRIRLPIFNVPEMKLQRIHCFPIHVDEEHSLVPDIEYSYIASQIQTQDFLLLKPEDAKGLHKVSNNIKASTYVMKLVKPRIKATLSTECVIKLVFNPLRENTNCKLRVQKPPETLSLKCTDQIRGSFQLQNPQ